MISIRIVEINRTQSYFYYANNNGERWRESKLEARVFADYDKAIAQIVALKLSQ